jgi:signal transduction histidine kinase
MSKWMPAWLVGFQLQAKAKNITLHATVSITEGILHTDEEALTRILDNLLSNALKFSPPGKQIFISQQVTSAGVQIAIRDEGPGISEEDQQKMFKKFQRLTSIPTQGESSTGLGLAIVKALTEKIGGVILVQSTIGVGTTFTLGIPTQDKSPSAAVETPVALSII